MPAVSPDIDTGERLVVRRLARLFRIERAGGFDRWPIATVRRLCERRGVLIDALIVAEERRAAGGTARSAEVDEALRELAQEVGRSRARAETRLEWLEAELRLRRGEGLPTGLRGDGGGQVLGRG